MKKNTHKKNNFINKCKKAFTWNNIKPILLGKSTGRRMFRLYFLLIIIFSILLYLPISFQPFHDYGYGARFNYVDNKYVMTPDYINLLGYKAQDQEITFSFIDSLFLSFSAFSDTGLTTVQLYNTFSTFGKLIIMLEVEVGGFGVMFFIFCFWKIFKHSDKLTVNQQLMAQCEKGNTKIGNTEKMLFHTVIVIIIIQFIFGLFYSLWFMYVPAHELRPKITTNTVANIYEDNPLVYSHLYHNAGFAFFAGFFHSVTAINNAGFDIIGSTSLTPYSQGIHTLFLLITIFEFVIGGIGFPVIFDFMAKFKVIKGKEFVQDPETKKVKRVYTVRVTYDKNYRISLMSKVALLGYGVVTIIGISFMFLFEYTTIGGEQYLYKNTAEMFGPNGEMLTDYNMAMNMIFQAMTTRSAGYYTFDNQLLAPVSKWLNIGLMFIGGSPSSTAGGIRVTTFMIMFIALWHKIKGSNSASIFKRRILNDDIINSFLVLLSSLILLAIGGAVLLNNIEDITEHLSAKVHHTDFTNSMFMVASAFGTTGLSVVDLSQLSWYSLVYLMFIMFVGQCGVSSTILAFRRNKIKENMYSYLPEPIKIG